MLTGGLATGYKFCPPLPLPDSIQRRRLLSDVLTNQRYSVVVIQGPAGHGKTTLLQQILQGSIDAGSAFGWLTLDESDNDISRFNTCLTTLVSNAVSDHSPDDIVSMPPGISTVEHILHLLDSARGPVSLFLDEFQTLSESVNIALLDTLIERSPPNVTFYIGSRSVPDLARGRLMISGQVKWITPEEIRFTAEEVHSFLDTVGLTVSDAEAKAFRDSTAGWPAALQLLQLALKGGKVDRSTLLTWAAGCQNELRDYLADNVMSSLPSRTRRFLQRTSLLNRLSAPLCETITGESNAQQLLQDLVAQGLFIRAVDVEQHWFSYHSIFSTYLNALIKRNEPDDIPRIHRQAATWYLDNSYPEEAVYHAISAGEHGLAADTLEAWAPQLIRSARLRTMEQLCDSLPVTEFNTRPMLAWGRAWALAFLNQKDRARAALCEFEQIIATTRASADMITSLRILKGIDSLVHDTYGQPTPWLEEITIITGDQSVTRCFEMGALANLQAIKRIYEGRLAEARELALLGESLSHRGEAAFSGAYATSLIAYTMIVDGHLRQALKRLSEGLNNEDMMIQGSLASACLSVIYGFALYESGNFAEAESLLSDNIDSISQTLTVDWLILAYLALARASAHSESKTSESIEILDRGERLGLINRSPRLVRAMRRERIRLAILSGKFGTGLELLDIPGASTEHELPEGWIYLSEDCDDDFICTARLNIYSGKTTQALGSLTCAIAAADTLGRVRRKIKLLILQSLAYLKLGEQTKSQYAIVDALALASAQDYVAVFVDEGSYCLELLAEFLPHETHSNRTTSLPFIRRILLAAGHDTGTPEEPASPHILVEKLTKKEQTIISLLINGASNTEIADQLFVSRNTVKFHLKNIYAKLGAKNRTQATVIARNLYLF